jgi:hypothetical protein
MGPSMGMRLSRSKAALKLAVNEPVPAMAEKRTVLLLLKQYSQRTHKEKIVIPHGMKIPYERRSDGNLYLSATKSLASAEFR